MPYTPFNKALPNGGAPDNQNGAAVLQSVRDNAQALRDYDFFGGDTGWTYSQSGGTANEPTVWLWSKGTERIRITATWTSNNVTAAVLEYSADSGTNYSTIETRSATYDADGNFTSGKTTLMLPVLQGLPGWTKKKIAALQAITISAGTGLSGGGNLTANRTLSFDTAWGDARYLPKTGGTLTGNLGVKTATFSVVTPGALNIDWTAGHRQAKDISASTTFTFTAPAGPANLLIKIKNTSASPRTLTWPAGVKWNTTLPPHGAISTGLYMFYYDGTTYWGSYIQGYAN